MAELVDALDSKSSDFGRAGSIPASSTKTPQLILGSFFMYYVYALSSLRRNYMYVGMTSDVKIRSLKLSGLFCSLFPQHFFYEIYANNFTNLGNARMHPICRF